MVNAPPNVLLHPDPLRLETELASRIRDLHRDDSLAPILVLAPTRRLVARLREVLAAKLGATLGVEVLHFQGLVYRRLTEDPAGAGLRAAPRALLEELTRSLIADAGGDLGAYAASRPGAVRSLASLLGELREAGVAPAAFSAVSERSTHRELAELYETYVAALTALAQPRDGVPGWADRAGLAERAGQCVVPTWSAVFVHGVYDLIGSNRALVSALRPEKGTTFLVPADPAAPSWSFARDTVRRHLGAWEVLSDTEKPTANLAAARHLGDPTSNPAATPDVDLVNTQGPEAELTHAARLALRHIADGVEPREIAIVARSLDRYAGPAELVFERHGLRVDSSMGRPARRHPKAITLKLLLTALALDFERQTLLDLFRSPWFARPEGPWPTDRLDRWSRDYRLVRSAESWTRDLPGAVESAPRPYALKDDPEAIRVWEARQGAEISAARGFAGVVRELDAEREAWSRARTAGDHVGFLLQLAQRWIVAWNRGDPAGKDPDAQELDRILGEILDDMDSLDAMPNRRDGTHPLTPQDALAFVESALAGATLSWSDPTGIRFLDMMQARALPFRHVILLGFNSGLFPRRARDVAFLPDRLREHLRTAECPLSLSREAPAEERLLLSLTLAQAREHLTLSWLRADTEGKAQSPSPFLRDIARVLPGRPSLRFLLEATDSNSRVARVPTHPVAATTWHAKHTGLVSLEELLLSTADAAGAQAADSVGAVLRREDPALAEDALAGLLLVDTIQEFGAGSLVYDGLVPDHPVATRPFSASAFDRLGECPQKYFFSYVLGIRALDDTAMDRKFRMDETGIAFHEVLDLVFKDLDARALLDGSHDAKTLQEAAGASLETRWPRVMGHLSHRMRRHLPGLWSQLEPMWREQLTSFLDDDLERLAEGKHRLLGSEANWEMESLDLSRGAELLREAGSPETAGGASTVAVRARLDRVTRDANDHVWITDYKTKGDLAKRTEAGKIIRGEKLQLALYLLMGLQRTGKPTTAELVGIGPDFPMRLEEKKRRARLEERTLTEIGAGLEETLLTLVGLVRHGRFPLNEDRHCMWCDFQAACRRFHHPTRERQRHHPTFRDYHDTRDKKMTGKKGHKLISLAAVRKKKT